MDWLKIIGAALCVVIAVAYSLMFTVSLYWLAVDLIIFVVAGWLVIPTKR